MSEQKKYVTFRDLRTASQKTANLSAPSTSIPSTSSTTSIPSTSSTTSIPSTSSTTSTSKPFRKDIQDKQLKINKSSSVAPERDFQRIPNSVTRQALPDGLFRGKSKQVWDYLWSISRGAVVPVRSVRKSRREIKVGSGLGSMVTVDAALEHLERVGLIAISPAIGSLIGNEYEVFTPEEACSSTTSISSTSSSTRLTSPTQKVVDLDILDSSISSTTQIVEDKGSYISPKTSFKTNTINTDDEAFAPMTVALSQAVKEVTGKNPAPSESERWKELADLLITELKIAAARTESISNVPAFLTEHLRRRLWKKDKQQLSEEGKSEATETKSANVGIDPSKCPDCGGSGMYYPEGYEKGVAKCKHERLKRENSGG